MKTLNNKQIEALSRLALNHDYQAVVAWVSSSIDEETSVLLANYGPARDEAAGGIKQLKQILAASENARNVMHDMATLNLSASGIP
jgi:hypothetical protein